MRSARLNGNVDMHSVLLSFWHWFEGKAEEKIAKKEPNETRNNEETMEKKSNRFVEKEPSTHFEICWYIPTYMHVYPYNSDETNDEKWEIYFAAARCVCVILFWFFFLLVVEPSSHHHLRRIAYQVTQEMSKVTLAHINFSGLSVQKYRFWY